MLPAYDAVTEAVERIKKKPMLPGDVSKSVGLKSPKVVKAAVLPVLKIASRLLGGETPLRYLGMG